MQTRKNRSMFSGKTNGNDDPITLRDLIVRLPYPCGAF